MSTRRPDPPASMTTQHDDDAPPASGLSSMQRAIMTIQKMRAKIENLERARVEPIAIIGMGCRLPGGANTPEAFFRLIENGVDTIREVPPERWRLEQEDPDTDAEARALRWGSFLDDVDRFDAAFFGISPREAESLDPQQRLLLEVAWEALERAGQMPERLAGSRTGVFVGIWALDYQQRVLALSPDKLDAYSFTGNVLSTAAGRLSYVLGLQGPAMSVETACSSSLTAIHLACQSLRSGESNLALAGGVNLMLSPTTTKLLSKTQALSPDGRCKTFDARANGFVRGEGCGVVVLKRLSDAERDGDPIIAVIRGSAVNQDGRSTGLTAPNVLSQQALLRQALENARVAPSDVGYVEAHGTGTSLGDPIEVEALKAV
ncbi:MAG TPA: polyketide synthase, partial [Polyangium sp.]|nr:polyketide synthase [Polyangium sp.]